MVSRIYLLHVLGEHLQYEPRGGRAGLYYALRTVRQCYGNPFATCLIWILITFDHNDLP